MTFGVVYKITNKINRKIYIGQTIRPIEERFKSHMTSKENKTALYKAVKKYGIDNFYIEVIARANNLNELNHREEYYIKLFNSLAPYGYNLKNGGLNKRYSEVSKQKMRDAHTGKILTEEHKKKIGVGCKQYLKDNPHKKGIGAKAMQLYMKEYLQNGGVHYKKGKKVSDESRKRISEAKKGEKNPMFGKKLNENQMMAVKKNAEKAQANAKKVRCIETGVIYSDSKKASQAIGCRRHSLTNVINKKRKTIYGLTFEYYTEESSEIK